MMMFMKSRVEKHLLRLLMTVVVMTGCTSLGVGDALNQRYGKEVPVNRLATPSTGADFYTTQVQPILENRCVVCHACYDAPCQLKLSSPDGIDRGASKQKVYDGTRLSEIMPTRLGIDAHSTREWRGLGFYPVLNERTQVPAYHSQASVLYRMLQLKQANPLPEAAVLDERYTVGLNREEVCPRLEEMEDFEKNHAQWGMPYGLPGLNQKEHATLTHWLMQGGPLATKRPLPASLFPQIDAWERFLNADTLKQQLASRYIYEHLFLAHLYFDDLEGLGATPPREFFQMVRSHTPPGMPISLIATRQPYDDPGVKRVYYRLQRDESTVVTKTHMPYALNAKQLAWMQSLFVTPNYTVTALPDYTPKTSSNPFVTFQALPVESRYRLMLEHAQFTIMGFIKGPVCRGQVALNVIDDHFWTVFVDPHEQNSQALAEFLVRQGKNMGIPSAEEESGAGVAKVWVEYSLKQKAYLEAKADTLNDFFSTGKKLDLSMIWDGEGHNPNAGLTIFRHFDSSTVEQGLLGQPPKTAWVISYPLLERIHYLLVAGFDVFGNIGHQLDTRLYMDFLRMEGEFNFLAFLPKNERGQLRDYWYRGATLEVHDYIFKPEIHFHQETGITYTSADPKRELYDLLKQKLGPVLNLSHDVVSQAVPYTQGVALHRLNAITGQAATVFPELSLMMIVGDKHADEAYTLIRNSGHSNIASLLNENDNRLPQEDYLTLLKGVVGAYPAVFWRVKEGDINRFVSAIENVRTEADYKGLLDEFGVRRTAPDFWAFSDRMHALYRRENPIEAGLLDYSRLENR